MTNHTITAYTDGASKGNPGPGGWGVVLRCEATGATKHIAGAIPQATNNVAELLAAIHALISLRRPGETVLIRTDSRYLSDGWNEWLPGWMERGWRNSRGKPVRNVELWQALVEAARPHDVSIEWVRGHNGDDDNEIADRLASGAADRFARTGEVGPWSERRDAAPTGNLRPDIYTFGYQGRRPVELLAEVERMNAIVIDVRLKPFSRAQGWSKPELERLLGDRYQSIPEFGNESFRSGRPVRIADAEAGIDRIAPLIRQGWTIILLCYEADPQTCHRTKVAQLLARQFGLKIRHLVR